MAIDKELYQQAYRQYQAWNRAEALEHAGNVGQISPLENWRRYVDLVEFCWRLQSQPSELQRTEKLSAWQRYYAHIQQFEAWRKLHGKTP